jgi:hypothetical protein
MGGREFEDHMWQPARNGIMPPPGLGSVLAFIAEPLKRELPGGFAAPDCKVDPRQGLEEAIRELLIRTKRIRELSSSSSGSSSAQHGDYEEVAPRPRVAARPFPVIPPPGLTARPSPDAVRPPSGPSSARKDSDIIDELLALKSRLAEALGNKGDCGAGLPPLFDRSKGVLSL